MTSHECSPLEWTASFDGTRDGPLILSCPHGATIRPGDTATHTNPHTGNVTTITIGEPEPPDPNLVRLRGAARSAYDATETVLPKRALDAVGYDVAALTKAHTRVATGADPEKTRAALRRLADAGITAAYVEHIPATLARLFHQETTMHVTDLNGTHLGKTITVTTKHETITGTLWDVTHTVAKISDDTLGIDPDDTPVYPGRPTHHLEVGAATAYLPGDAEVEVHP